MSWFTGLRPAMLGLGAIVLLHSLMLVITWPTGERVAEVGWSMTASLVVATATTTGLLTRAFRMERPASFWMAGAMVVVVMALNHSVAGAHELLVAPAELLAMYGVAGVLLVAGWLDPGVPSEDT